MNEPTMIDDVRAAKKWVDAQSNTFDEVAARLRKVEQAWKDRTGIFANVPRGRPDWIQSEIDAAADAPGRELLDETRTGR